jgi:hypothetical protein
MLGEQTMTVIHVDGGKGTLELARGFSTSYGSHGPVLESEDVHAATAKVNDIAADPM